MVSANFNPVNDVILLIVFVGGVVVYSRSRIPAQTIKNLQDLTDSQAKSIAELKEARIEDSRLIGELKGQLQAYKELPFESFKDLSVGIKEVVKISKDNAHSNQLILESLLTTAKINAKDRDVLTKKGRVRTLIVVIAVIFAVIRRI
jgi:hypothetical protein